MSPSHTLLKSASKTKSDPSVQQCVDAALSAYGPNAAQSDPRATLAEILGPEKADRLVAGMIDCPGTARFREAREAIVAKLGDALDHQGQRYNLCGALGGVAAQQRWPHGDVEKLIRQWLPVGNAKIDVANGVNYALSAFTLKDPFKATGIGDLTSILGEDTAEAIADAMMAPTPHGKWCARITAREKAKAAARQVVESAGPDLPLAIMIKPGGSIALNDPPGFNSYTEPMSDRVVRVKAHQLFGKMPPFFTGDGRHVKDMQEVMVELGPRGQLTGRVDLDFRTSANTWAGGKKTLTLGIKPADIEPRRDVEVDAWLHALSGDRYGAVSQWIASCAQEHLGGVASALIIIGPPSVGKSLLFIALAKLWDQPAPAPLSAALAQFNASIANSPLVWDDEAVLLKAGKLSSAVFKRMIADRSRQIEPKGKERRELHGAMRYGVTANSIEDIRFSDLRGQDGLAAVTARLLVVQVTNGPAATEALRPFLLDGTNADLDRIAAHLRWIQTTVKVDPGRFAATIEGDEAAQIAALAGTTSKHPELFEVLHGWLDSGKQPGTRTCLWWKGPELCVSTSGLVDALLSKGRYDLARVQEALSPFQTGRKTIRTKSRSEGDCRVMAWVLNVEALIQATGADVDRVAASCMALGGSTGD